MFPQVNKAISCAPNCILCHDILCRHPQESIFIFSRTTSPNDAFGCHATCLGNGALLTTFCDPIAGLSRSMSALSMQQQPVTIMCTLQPIMHGTTGHTVYEIFRGQLQTIREFMYDQVLPAPTAWYSHSPSIIQLID